MGQENTSKNLSADEDDWTIVKNKIYLTWHQKKNICISIVVVNGADTGKIKSNVKSKKYDVYL